MEPTTLESIGKKIVAALKAEKEGTGKVPQYGLAFGFWFAKIASSIEMDFLDKVEAEKGDNFVNNWLCDVLVKSELYARDDAGNVWAQVL